MRLPTLAWTTLPALALTVDLEQYCLAPVPGLPSPIYALNIAMRLSLIVYLFTLATAVIRRRPKSGSSRDRTALDGAAQQLLDHHGRSFSSPRAFARARLRVYASRACRRFACNGCGRSTARLVQRNGRGTTARGFGRLPAGRPPPLSGRGNRDNRWRHPTPVERDDHPSCSSDL